MSAVLRVYVELLSSRPHDWPSHFRFFPVPLPAAPLPQIVRSLCQIDAGYAAAFAEPDVANSQLLLQRLKLYLSQAKACHPMPIGECMLCKGETTFSFRSRLAIEWNMG